MGWKNKLSSMLVEMSELKSGLQVSLDFGREFGQRV
jgi:hypothetical protein